MCDFGVTEVAIASLAISAAGAAASVAAQIQQQNAQKAYQNKLAVANKQQMDENADLANKAYLNQAQQANIGLAEQAEANATANQGETIKRVQAQGEVEVAAAGAGVGGSSLESLLSDFHRQEDMFRQHNDQNLLFKTQQTGASNIAFQNEAEGRNLSVKPYIPSPVSPVDYAGPLLSVAGTGTQMYGMKLSSQNAALSKG